MRHFHWTPAKSVYVPELDAEHRNLYQIAEEIQRAMSAGSPLGEVLPQIRALVAAAEDHLRHEERLMTEAHYQLQAWHTKQHDTLRQRAADLMGRIEAEDLEAASEMLDYFADWLKEHTGVADRMLAAALRAHERQLVARR